MALAAAAIQSGFGAYFITAHDLATDLGKAYREGRLDRRMRIYLAPKVLVIDELGYLPLPPRGQEGAAASSSLAGKNMQNLTEDSNSARRPQSVEIYGPLLGCGQSQTLGPRGGGSETGGYIVHHPEESSVPASTPNMP